MDKIVKFFECLVPVSVCNLKCEYCYVIQENNRHMKLAEFKYSPEHIGKAFSQKRLGGVCFVSICGAGETLAQDQVVDIVYNILAQGHYVNITNNGTMTKRIERLMTFPKEFRERLHFSFSFHYKELERLNLLDTFFNNVATVKKMGCSYLVQMNLCDSYIKEKDKIKQLCMERIGALPQIAVTRDEKEVKFKFFTNYTDQEYIDFGNEFDSEMFKLGVENINRKQNDFCYAGSWSFRVDLATGMAKRCYAEYDFMNFFENIDKPIKPYPIGRCCKSKYCINSIHFLALGMVPEYKCGSYGEIRNRKCLDGTTFLNSRTEKVFQQKLYDNNHVYTKFELSFIKAWGRIKTKLKGAVKKILRK